MRRLWAVLVLAVFVAGCSTTMKEVGFQIPDTKDGKHYIVNRDFVNERVWISQPQLNGDFHCTGKRTSEEMAKLRAAEGPDQTWYTGCTSLSQHPKYKNVFTKIQNPGLANFWGDISKTLALSGAIAYTGHQIGKGLGRSGDTVTQSGNAEANSDSDADADNLVNSGNKTTNVNPTKNINSHNKIEVK